MEGFPDCEFRVEGGCGVAERECGLGPGAIQVNLDHCRYCCTKSKPGPRQLNSVTASLVHRYLRGHDRDLLKAAWPRLKQFVECANDRPPAVTTKHLLLTSFLSPGDIMTLTAAVESIKRSFGSEYVLGVETTCMEIWGGNPHIATLDPTAETTTRLHLEYPLVHQSNQLPVSFLHGYLDYISRVLGRDIRIRVNRPCLYLTEEERSWIGRVEELQKERLPYWVINAGTKDDFTCKRWPVEYYQDVVDRTRGWIQWVQIGEAGHNHTALDGVLNQIGQTTPRELIRLVYHSAGGLGPVTWLQHLCAAWEKPYVCLLGGREPLAWTQYPLQYTLHTLGALDCCRTQACWRSRVVALHDGKEQDESLCAHPEVTWRLPVPGCMARISPTEVVMTLERIVRGYHVS